MFSRDFVPSLLQFPFVDKPPMDNHVHLPFIQSFPVDLVITRYPEILSMVLRIPCAYCLAVLCHLNTPTDNFPHLSSIRSSPVDSGISQKSLKCHSIIQKILSSQFLLKVLLACIMVNPISLVVLLASHVIIILSLLTQYVCE